MRNITVTKGIGIGPTKIAAFDAALFNAGIADFNLIRLSSIIPPDSEISIQKYTKNDLDFGNKLYLVYASEIQSEVGKAAWAGIGWVRATDASGKGLFTEHEGHSEEEVRNLINETLSSMITYRAESYGPIECEIVGVPCVDKPVCALVAAVYESESWS